MKKSDCIFTGYHGDCHIQGIAVDEKNGFIYCSFTTKLIKLDFNGRLIGSVDGLTGHLGCIDYRESDGRVYGSLEYKNDSIGRGIRRVIGDKTECEDAFYAAVFDVDRIDRPRMHALDDGVMRVAYLSEVVGDYNGAGVDLNGCPVPHRYGCSGIDGTAAGPVPGSDDGKDYLFIAYGIYADENRGDNDHQIILRYDFDEINRTARPLDRAAMHRSGPEKPLDKYFVFTGNTRYGVQNLEYDAARNAYFMAVYRGGKPQYPNYDLFMIDASVKPQARPLKGLNESGSCLTLKKAGEYDEKTGISGFFFEHGSTGLFADGRGGYLISEPGRGLKGEYGRIYHYTFSEADGFVR